MLISHGSGANENTYGLIREYLRKGQKIPGDMIIYGSC